MRTRDMALYEYTIEQSSTGSPKDDASATARAPAVAVAKPSSEFAIQVRGRGSGSQIEVTTGREPALEELRRRFESTHAVHLPALIEADLLARVIERIGDGDAARGGAQLLFMLNDSALFAAIDRITGLRSSSSFSGALRKVREEGDRVRFWAGNLIGRSAGLRICLDESPRPGGALQVRERDARTEVFQACELKPGDALLYRNAPELQQRETRLGDESARILFEGRFHRGEPHPLLRTTANLSVR